MDKEMSNEEAFDTVEAQEQMPKTSSKKGIKVVDKKVKNSYEGVKLENGEDEDELEDSEESEENPEEDNEDEAALVKTDFTPKLSSKSQEQKEIENGVKKEMNGKILIVESIKILPPKMNKIVDGVKIEVEPKVTQNKGAEFYSSKLQVRFKEDNIVEYYPSISFWVNRDEEGNPKISEYVSLDRKGNSKVSQLVRLILQKMSGHKFELETQTINERPSLVVTEKTKKEFEAFSRTKSDEEILKFLVGKKVKVSTATGKYNGKAWFRNDIVEVL